MPTFRPGRRRWWRAIRSATVKTYLCPVDDNNQNPFQGDNGGNWARGNYAANAGPSWPWDSYNGGSNSSNFGVPGGGVKMIGLSFSV